MTLPREITDILAKYDRFRELYNNDEDDIYREINEFMDDIHLNGQYAIMKFLKELHASNV